VQQQILTPDIDDERHTRLERHDVGEVLVRADSEVCAARLDGLGKPGNDPLERVLVRNEVV
jgi:hypothetical protein